MHPLTRGEIGEAFDVGASQRFGDVAVPASTLNERGPPFIPSRRLERSADRHLRARAAGVTRVGERFRPFALRDLADTLRRFGRHDETRAAITKATRLATPFGHGAERPQHHATRVTGEPAVGAAAVALATRSSPPPPAPPGTGPLSRW